MVSERSAGLVETSSVARMLPIDGYPLSLRAGYLLRRTNRLHGQHWAARGTELTSPQFGVLSALQRHPGIDQHTLGSLVSLDRASIAGIVRRLVDRGQIDRARDPRDSRRNVLTLSADVGPQIERHRGIAADIWDEMFAPVPANERDRFIGHLAAIANFLPEERDAGALFRRLDQKRATTWTRVMGTIFTGAQYAVIHVVGQWPGLSQTEVAELAALDKATAAEVVDRLEARGWLLRHPDESDGRVRRLRLTSDALQTVRTLMPRLNQVQRTLLEAVPADDKLPMLRSWGLVAYAGHVPESAR